MSDDGDNLVLFPLDAEIAEQARSLHERVVEKRAAVFAAAYVTPDGQIFTNHSSIRGVWLIAKLWEAVGYLDEDLRALVAPWAVPADECHAPSGGGCEETTDQLVKLRVVEGDDERGERPELASAPALLLVK